MAFPVIVDADTQNAAVTTNATSWTLTYPTNLASGDLIVCLMAADGLVDFTFPAGWVGGNPSASGAVSICRAAKISDGTETGNFTVDLSATEQGAWRIFRITGWYGGSLGDLSNGDGIDSTFAAFATGNPDPPSLDPTNWATEDTLWIAACAVDASRAVSTWPLADRQTSQESGGGAGATLAVCTTISAVSSLNPDTFTISASDDWAAVTIGIRPEAIATRTITHSLEAVPVTDPPATSQRKTVSFVTE